MLLSILVFNLIVIWKTFENKMKHLPVGLSELPKVPFVLTEPSFSKIMKKK